MGAAADPQALADVLITLVERAVAQAQQMPAAVGALLAETLSAAGDTATDAVQLTEDPMRRLRELVAPPDWNTLLLFGMMRLVEADPEKRLALHAVRAAGDWSAGYRLTFTTAGTTASLTLAVLDAQAPHRGVIIDVAGTTPITSSPEGPLVVEVTPGGAGRWQIPVGGPIPAPAGAGSCRLKLILRLGREVPAPDGVSVSVGDLWISVVLPSAGLGWTATAGFGTSEQPGLALTVEPEALLPPDLVRIVAVSPIQESCTPTLTLRAGAPPELHPGHRGVV
ncbi:hypothetical protein [Actinoplanes sp. DH11]|uniref:hypothetical protein n=1 Tax=Actinoplanes sp. DH11 TaxID=2857011 RepID=UPI001E5CFACF|nr:hypothetical protein [Actinoplanes sp. DH11]